jgi:hypothetical protein
MDRFTAEAWQLLLYNWDSAYVFGYDEDPRNPEPFSAARRDDPAVVLTAKDPEALSDQVYLNYRERKVPREFAP